MESVGYEYFRAENPKQTVNVLWQRVKPVVLRNKKCQRLKYDRPLENNVPRLIRKLKSEAIASQRYGYQVSDSRGTDPAHPNNGRTHGISGGRSAVRGGSRTTTTDGNDSSSTSRKQHAEPHKKEPSFCLYEPCEQKAIKHELRDCHDCPHGIKKQLLADFEGRVKVLRAQLLSHTITLVPRPSCFPPDLVADTMPPFVPTLVPISIS